MIGDLVRALKAGSITPSQLDDLCRKLNEIEARDNILRAWIQPGSLDPSFNGVIAQGLEVKDKAVFYGTVELTDLAATGVFKVDGTQVVGPRVVDARADDAANSGDATTDGLIDALRDAMIAHGLVAAA